MKHRRNRLSGQSGARWVLGAAVAGALFASRPLLAEPVAPPEMAAAAATKAPLTDHQKSVHVLNRLGFGARPGDVERVESMGYERYIQAQLHPETIDDSIADKAVAQFDSLRTSPKHLTVEYWHDVVQFVQDQMKEGNADELKLKYGVDVKKMYGAGAAARRQSPH